MKAHEIMAQAHQAAAGSKCLRRQVGAVLYRDGEILGVGCNATPPEVEPCVECSRAGFKSGESLGCCQAIHAEHNAIIAAHEAGHMGAGATLVCTDAPCADCARIISAVGISMVIYHKPYPATEASLVLMRAGVRVGQLL
jgi:dCMP deaminase